MQASSNDRPCSDQLAIIALEPARVVFNNARLDAIFFPERQEVGEQGEVQGADGPDVQGLQQVWFAEV